MHQLQSFISIQIFFFKSKLYVKELIENRKKANSRQMKCDDVVELKAAEYIVKGRK